MSRHVLHRFPLPYNDHDDVYGDGDQYHMIMMRPLNDRDDEDDYVGDDEVNGDRNEVSYDDLTHLTGFGGAIFVP